MWNLTIYSLGGQHPRMTHRPVFGSDTICNHPSPLPLDLCSSLQSMWDLTIHPPWGSVFSLAHRPMFGSDTICNSPSALAHYVLKLHGFETRLLGKGFHTLVRNDSFPSPIDVISHNPPLLGANVFASTPLGVWL